MAERLLLSAGKAGGLPFAERLEQREQLIDGVGGPGPFAVPVAADQQVLVDGQAREHPAAFGHRRDAQLHALVRRHVVDRLTVEKDAAASRPKNTGHGLQHGALAGAVRPDAGEDLALFDRDVDVVEGLKILVVDAGVFDLVEGSCRRPSHVAGLHFLAVHDLVRLAFAKLATELDDD